MLKVCAKIVMFSYLICVCVGEKCRKIEFENGYAFVDFQKRNTAMRPHCPYQCVVLIEERLQSSENLRAQSKAELS